VPTSAGCFRCTDGCDYDLCVECASKQTPLVAVSCHPHLLAPASRHDAPQLHMSGAIDAAWNCNDIGPDHGARFGFGSANRFRCIEGCDFDLCLSCTEGRAWPSSDEARQAGGSGAARVLSAQEEAVQRSSRPIVPSAPPAAGRASEVPPASAEDVAGVRRLQPTAPRAPSTPASILAAEEAHAEGEPSSGGSFVPGDVVYLRESDRDAAGHPVCLALEEIGPGTGVMARNTLTNSLLALDLRNLRRLARPYDLITRELAAYTGVPVVPGPDW
jgi:hypothetical protein